MERIGFGSRLGALIVDAIIVLIVLIIALSIFGISAAGSIFGLLTGNAAVAATGGVALVGGIAVAALFPLVYSAFEILKAATPGKMVFGLVIRNADGTPASRKTLTIRWLVKFSEVILNGVGRILSLQLFMSVSSYFGILIFFGCFLVLGSSKQALHDMVAKTAVFKAG